MNSVCIDSYWLAVHGLDQPRADNDIDLIGRCNVCEGKATVVTIHSQTQRSPNCPSGYSSLWHGYSYFMVAFVVHSYLLCPQNSQFVEHWSDWTR